MGPLEDEAKKGDRIQTLKKLRDYLAKALDECKSGRDQAALSRQLVLVLQELAQEDVETSDRFAELTKDLTTEIEW